MDFLDLERKCQEIIRAMQYEGVPADKIAKRQSQYVMKLLLGESVPARTIERMYNNLLEYRETTGYLKEKVQTLQTACSLWRLTTLGCQMRSTGYVRKMLC